MADQLQALTVLAETLTIRLLELEERLQQQERQLMPVDEDPSHLELELRLEDTDQRLLRIESLLEGLDRSPSQRVLQEVPRPVLQQGLATTELEDPDELFPDEGEQPFMDDERVA